MYEKQSLDPYVFRVVVPIGNIRMISFFDQKVYPAFIMEKRDDLDDNAADQTETA